MKLTTLEYLELLGEDGAIAFANDTENDEKIQRSLRTWDLVKCKNCGKHMSLIGANYDENYAPIHKFCGGRTWTS